MMRRDGMALIAAIVIMIVLDCVVIGTLHFAVMEQKLARNAGDVLRLRLAAESAARAALWRWPMRADSLAPGASMPLDGVPAAEQITTSAVIQRVSDSLWLIRARASLNAPGQGSATAVLVLRAPVLRPDLRAVDGAIYAHGLIVHETADVLEGACSTGRPSAFVAGAPDSSDARFRRISVAASTVEIDRAPSLPADSLITVRAGSTVLEGETRGVILVRGDLMLPAGAHVSGLLIVIGSLVIAEGARVDGVIHASGDVTLGGTLSFDPCLVRHLLNLTGTGRPRPPAGRMTLPPF